MLRANKDSVDVPDEVGTGYLQMAGPATSGVACPTPVGTRRSACGSSLMVGVPGGARCLCAADACNADVGRTFSPARDARDAQLLCYELVLWFFIGLELTSMLFQDLQLRHSEEIDTATVVVCLPVLAQELCGRSYDAT